MNNNRFDEILKIIAQRHGVSVEEVRRDMQIGLEWGQQSSDPKVQERWRAIQNNVDEVTPQSVVEHLAEELHSK